jgi:hypothetical protein
MEITDNCVLAELFHRLNRFNMKHVGFSGSVAQISINPFKNLQSFYFFRIILSSSSKSIEIQSKAKYPALKL